MLLLPLSVPIEQEADPGSCASFRTRSPHRSARWQRREAEPFWHLQAVVGWGDVRLPDRPQLRSAGSGGAVQRFRAGGRGAVKEVLGFGGAPETAAVQRSRADETKEVDGPWARFGPCRNVWRRVQALYFRRERAKMFRCFFSETNHFFLKRSSKCSTN